MQTLLRKCSTMPIWCLRCAATLGDLARLVLTNLEGQKLLGDLACLLINQFFGLARVIVRILSLAASLRFRYASCRVCHICHVCCAMFAQQNCKCNQE